MPYKYSTDAAENSARAVGISLPVSTKHSIEICSYVRGKPVERAKTMLEEVIAKKMAVPFRRFTESVGHRKGNISAGRYPIKASMEILKLIKSAEANAQFKGLSVSDLVVRHISAQRAAGALHYGRHRGREQKRTSVEVVVEEKRVKKEKEVKKGEKEVKGNDEKAKPQTAPKPEPKNQELKTNNEKPSTKTPEPKTNNKEQSTTNNKPKTNDDKNEEKKE